MREDAYREIVSAMARSATKTGIDRALREGFRWPASGTSMPFIAVSPVTTGCYLAAPRCLSPCSATSAPEGQQSDDHTYGRGGLGNGSVVDLKNRHRLAAIG